MEVITSQTILNLLRAKHESQNDLFFSELNTGEARTGVTRMDGWAMPRSWSKPECTTYEIKVSRSDFKKDEKWQTYLPYCNYLYFVCPPGIISPEELPPEAGLYVISSNGKKLFKKKIASRRDVEIPSQIFRLALMKSKPSRDYYSNRGTMDGSLDKLEERKKRAELLSEAVSERKSIMELGHRISNSLSSQYRERVVSVEAENQKLKNLVESFQELEKYLDSLGMNRKKLQDHWFAKNRAKELIYADVINIPPGMEEQIASVKRSLSALEESIQNIKKVG